MRVAQGEQLELGVYTFGSTPRTDGGELESTAQGIRKALEATHLAEKLGLDFFRFRRTSHPLNADFVARCAGECHWGVHTLDPARNHCVGTSTDEHIRVFLQLTKAATIAPGRIDIFAGRGSSAITFSVFGLDEGDWTCPSTRS